MKKLFDVMYKVLAFTLVLATLSFAVSTGFNSLTLLMKSDSSFALRVLDTSENTVFQIDTDGDLSNSDGAMLVSTMTTNDVGVANSVWGASNSFVFEGATANAYELSLAPTDPTADRTVTFPDASGTVMLVEGASDAANGLFQSGQDLKYEGTTANAYEGIIRFPSDPTQDQILVLPNASGYPVYSISDVDEANSLYGGTGTLIFEGSTADAYEITLGSADPTADRTVTLPDASGTVPLNNVLAFSATATATVANLYGAVNTNTGAGGAVVISLPAPAVGMECIFYLTAAQDVDINPLDGTQILVLTDATGDAISSDATIGSYVHLKGISATEWIPLDTTGTWSDVN